VYFAAFGFSKQLAASRRYNLHAGLEGIVLIYNGKKGEAKSQEYVYNSPPMPNPYRNQKSVYTGEQAYSVGINSFVGFDIRLCRHLLLGSDFSMACLYTNLYGSRSEEYDQYGPNLIPYTATTIIPRHVQTFGFSQISYTMNLTYLF
jgi:hypothetical protein